MSIDINHKNWSLFYQDPMANCNIRSLYSSYVKICRKISVSRKFRCKLSLNLLNKKHWNQLAIKFYLTTIIENFKKPSFFLFFSIANALFFDEVYFTFVFNVFKNFLLWFLVMPGLVSGSRTWLCKLMLFKMLTVRRYTRRRFQEGPCTGQNLINL